MYTNTLFLDKINKYQYYCKIKIINKYKQMQINSFLLNLIDYGS